MSPTILERTRQQVIDEGYLQLSSLLDVTTITTLASAVRSLVAMGCPPVFGFVYDEFWAICAQLQTVLSTVLGQGYRQLPDFWAWHVDPATESTGWRPHRDKASRR